MKIDEDDDWNISPRGPLRWKLTVLLVFQIHTELITVSEKFHLCILLAYVCQAYAFAATASCWTEKCAFKLHKSVALNVYFLDKLEHHALNGFISFLSCGTQSLLAAQISAVIPHKIFVICSELYYSVGTVPLSDIVCALLMEACSLRLTSFLQQSRICCRVRLF